MPGMQYERVVYFPMMFNTIIHGRRCISLHTPCLTGTEKYFRDVCVSSQSLEGKIKIYKTVEVSIV